MTTTSAQARDITMKGGGYYSAATKGAKDVIDRATPLVLRALESMNVGQSESTNAFTMTDMGCADGGTSIGMVGDVIQVVRSQAKERPIVMLYTDQPRNDYNALFQIIHGLTDTKSDLDQFDGVHVMASATSFYRPILPPETLDLGFSATAMHWLSRKPCDISDHVHMVGASGAELAMFAEQGHSDWEAILAHRATELKSGGRLVLVNFGRDEAGRYLGNTGGINMFDTFNSLWQQMLEAGVIKRDEYTAMTLPQYYNTVEEFSAPLIDPNNRVYQAGLRLEHIETRVVECPFAAEYRVHGDVAKFASDYIPTLRSWTESTFYAALSDERPLTERQQIIDRFYATYAAQVCDNPTGHGMDYVHVYMIISKQ